MNDWVMIVAVLCGPILAVQAQKWIEVAREKRNQRLFVFKRLMATRGVQLSPGHVEALNMIDLEFAGRGKKNETVRRRWKEYLDNLNSLDQDLEKQKEQLQSWTQRNQELLADLLCDMGLAVGHDFDKVQIRRGIYTPVAHANFELEHQYIRRMLIQLLAGDRTLPLDVRSLPTMVPPEETAAPPKALRDAEKRESPRRANMKWRLKSYQSQSPTSDGMIGLKSGRKRSAYVQTRLRAFSNPRTGSLFSFT